MKTRRNLHSVFEPWMIAKAREHVDSGWSISCFPGHFQISEKNWQRFLRESPELREIRQDYLNKIKRTSKFEPYMKGLK